MSKWRITHTPEGYRLYRKVGPFWVKSDSDGKIISPWYFLTPSFDDAEKTVRKLMAKEKFKRQHWYFGD